MSPSTIFICRSRREKAQTSTSRPTLNFSRLIRDPSGTNSSNLALSKLNTGPSTVLCTPGFPFIVSDGKPGFAGLV